MAPQQPIRQELPPRPGREGPRWWRLHHRYAELKPRKTELALLHAERALGAAAKDYCAAVQIYFDYCADGLAVSSAVNESINWDGYAAVQSGPLPAGVEIRGITAMLEADNTLRLYLDFTGVDPSTLTYKIDGNGVDLKQRSGGAYYLALDTGVVSNKLQETHTYSISDGTNTYTVTASVLTYARSCALYGSNETEINLGKTLYRYNQAAVTAFGQ